MKKEIAIFQKRKADLLPEDKRSPARGENRQWAAWIGQTTPIAEAIESADNHRSIKFP
jgi:hypothetical protein